MVKPDLICFGTVLGWGGKAQNFPEALSSKISPVPWCSGLSVRIGEICLAKHELLFCTASTVLLTYRASEAFRLSKTSKVHPPTNILAIHKLDVAAVHLLPAPEKCPTGCLMKVGKHPSVDRRSV